MPAKKKQKTSEPFWEYKLEGKWSAFADDDSETLEDAYQNGGAKIFTTKKLTFNKGYGTKYTFNFKKMTQTNEDTDKSRPIRRNSGSKDDSDDSDDSDSDNDDNYQWEWMDDSGMYVAFYDEDNDLIEKLYWKAKKKGTQTTDKLSFNKGFDTDYDFNFTKMTQLNTDSDKKRKIRRGKKAKAWKISNYGITKGLDETTKAGKGLNLAVPSYWSKQKKSVDLVDVDLSTSEATNILKNFKTTVSRPVKIHKLTRIQHSLIWPFFAMTKHSIAQKNGGNPNVKTLFHGCRVRQNMDAIINFGFDMRVAAQGAYGVGIYFAVNANYSDGGYVLQNPDKSKEMFICRVICGAGTNGASGLRRPPPKVASKPNGELYDSVHNPGANVMHIVFDNKQCIPEYIVKYT